MLETILVAFVVAGLTSMGVDFMTAWTTRIRVRRLEVQLAEWEERLVREVKQRAAAASVQARQRLNPIDEALIKKHTDGVYEPADQDAPWWDHLVGKRDGS